MYNTCHRGDWLLWLFARTNPKDLQLLTLAKGHCANTVRHLMRDERSRNAVDVSIAFGEGKATRKELDNSAYYASNAATSSAAAYVSAATTSSSTDSHAAYASSASAFAASDAATAASAFAASDAATASFTAKASTSASKAENQLLTADICRKYLPFEIWNI